VWRLPRHVPNLGGARCGTYMLRLSTAWPTTLATTNNAAVGRSIVGPPLPGMSLTIMVVSPIMASVGFDGQSWWALMVSPCIASIGQAC
jgi:hypothetical protein